MWMIHIITGLILLWLGIKILRPKRQLKFDRNYINSKPAGVDISRDRAMALDRADKLVAQLDEMIAQEAKKLHSLQMGLDLNSQVALDAIAQSERAKLALVRVLRESGCNESEIRAILSQIEE